MVLLDGDDFCTSDNTTDFSRERSDTSVAMRGRNVNAIFLFAENSMRLLRKLKAQGRGVHFHSLRSGTWPQILPLQFLSEPQILPPEI